MARVEVEGLGDEVGAGRCEAEEDVPAALVAAVRAGELLGAAADDISAGRVEPGAAALVAGVVFAGAKAGLAVSREGDWL
jgi:hypothetical protein